MPVKRLMRIAGLAKGATGETREYFTVTRRDVSESLAEVCQTYAAKLHEIEQENDAKPNHLVNVEILPAIEEAGAHILKTYPPATHAYIGLGASPAPLTKYLELSKQRDHQIEVYDLPLSGLQGIGGTIKGIWEANGPEKANLTAFINQYLSTFASLAKRVIVIDRSSHSRSRKTVRAASKAPCPPARATSPDSTCTAMHSGPWSKVSTPRGSRSLDIAIPPRTTSRTSWPAAT